MNTASARPAKVSVDAVLTSALRAFLAFPGPGLAYFALMAVWTCAGSGGGALDPASLMAGPSSFDFIVWLAGALLIGWVMCGLARVAIAGVRGEEATWNDTIVSLSEYFHAATALGTWITLAMFGFLFFVVPGVLAFLIWSQAFCCAIDFKESWTAALGHSRRITRGHHGQILGVMFGIAMLFVPGTIVSASAVWNSAPDLEALLGSGFPAASGQAAVAFDPAVVATMLLAAVLGAAAQTAASYIGAALYVALQDVYAAAGPDSAVARNQSSLP
ncbi:MAG: hypothetical protein HY899_10360 [Deltaproteobacteria bacterium]|nr:hypothetical protein [Deltaproteobacteria bacterium]